MDHEMITIIFQLCYCLHLWHEGYLPYELKTLTVRPAFHYLLASS